MVSKSNIEDLFHEWNELNIQAQEFLGQFDFTKIKEIRAKQSLLEDTIYEILIENAPEDILKILPSDCGEMEIGYENEERMFYYVTFDPEYDDTEDTTLIAFTIDLNKSVSTIKDFKMEE